MSKEKQKNILIATLIVVILGVGLFFYRTVQRQEALIAELMQRQPPGKDGRVPTDPYIAGPVKNRILKGYKEIQVCYKNFLAQNPSKTDGVVTIDWQIDTSGNAINPQVVTSELDNELLKKCMIEKISKWHFPEPMVQKYVVHRFKFNKAN